MFLIHETEKMSYRLSCAGSNEKRDPVGPDTAEQHNGVDGFGVDGDHAELGDGGADVGRRLRAAAGRGGVRGQQ